MEYFTGKTSNTQDKNPVDSSKATPETRPSFDPVTIRAHVSLLHELAAGIDGVLVLVAIEEGAPARPQHFRVGDVETMVGAIMGFENHPKVNLYAPFAVMRRDLALSKKGGEGDVVVVLAAVGDLDNDKNDRLEVGDLPLAPAYVMESSAGNFQPVYPFEKPLAVQEAKPILEAFGDGLGGDSGPKDCSHIWRIAGTLNVPTKTKLARGRSKIPHPVRVVKAFDGARFDPRLILEKFAKAKADRAPSKARPEPGDSRERIDWPSVESALAAIPNDGAGLEYDDWVKVGMALHWSRHDRARELWDTWSRKSAKFDAASQETAWRGFRAERSGEVVTILSLYDLARKHGWGEELLSRAAHYENAEKLIDRKFRHEKIRTLLHHQAVFYEWRRTHYAELPREQIRGDLWTFLAKKQTRDSKNKIVPFAPNRDCIGNVIEALAAQAQLHGNVTFPFWDVEAPFPADEILSCTNGLLHLPTRRLLAHTPLFRNMFGLNYAFDPNAPKPTRWLKFLSELWPNDPQSIGTLQELFGLLLTSDCSFQKVFLLIGPKRSGKGTIGRILRATLGEENVAGPTLSGIGGRFGLQPLIHKPLAIISDARIGPRTDIPVVTERLLSISGEDALNVERKNTVDWIGRLPTRFLILTNVLPKLTDASGALVSRFVILQITESFYGKEDRDLLNKLMPELPGILNWSLEGLDRLQKRGHFEMPETAKETLEAFEDLSNPVGVFLRECCAIGPGAEVEIDVLFSAWESWCERNNRKEAGTSQSFGAELHAAAPGLKRTRHRVGDDKLQKGFYQGVGLIKPEPSTHDTDYRKQWR